MNILCGGCFNHLHLGHVYFLKEAKKLGKKLFVVVSHDFNNKKLNARCSKERIAMLKNLKIADHVVLGEKKNFLKIVKNIKPDIICLGYDQKIPRQIKLYLNKIEIKTQRVDKLKDYEKAKNKYLGRIFSGEQKANKFLSLDYYKTEIEKIIKKKVFPGTLNVKLSDFGIKYSNKYEVKEFTDNAKREYGGLELFWIKITAKIKSGDEFEMMNLGEKAWVVKAKKSMYNKNVLEIVHDLNLRQKFNLKDNDIIEVEIL